MGGNNPAAATADPATEANSASEDEYAAATGKRPGGDRAGLIAGIAVLAACAALVLYGVLHTGSDDGSTAHHRTPTAPVTYEVTGTGTAELTYQARSASGRATVVHAAHLPWHTTVDVPLGKQPIISIVLGHNGGQAHCSLAIHGKHAQSATASGPYGRATCTATLPKGPKR
ncbi:hypothetical protein [Streptomyces sp. NRRL F-5126]|uniref:hypothetical protein n=1 Tax=Streptomyces sp. NRRL F-5126 TaxID=1463857 RepID=UPI000AED3044|nr:hypothetical protein [Streptomyces sp. NRRL F-5126]